MIGMHQVIRLAVAAEGKMFRGRSPSRRKPKRGEQETLPATCDNANTVRGGEVVACPDTDDLGSHRQSSTHLDEAPSTAEGKEDAQGERGNEADEGDEVTSGHEKIGLAKVKEVQDFLGNLLASMSKRRKLVVFAHHRSVMAELYSWAVRCTLSYIAPPCPAPLYSWAVSTLHPHPNLNSNSTSPT